MDYSKILASSDQIPIGKLVLMLRNAMGFNQREFSECVAIARGSLVRLENTQQNTDIGTDMLYRLYYISSRLEDNTSNGYINKLAHDIKQEVIHVIEN